MRPTKYFFDTEFYEDGRVIHPISLGIVSEFGHELYMEFAHEHLPLNPWVKEHVVPQLSWHPKDRHMAYGTVARQKLVRYIMQIQPGIHRFGKRNDVEFWAYYASYDWIVLCQIFGTMRDLPHFFPMFCRDLQQEYARRGSPSDLKPPEPANAHNALEDARWNLDFYRNLTK